ncbi:MAG: ATP-binding cassette domain-containing protein [Desulfobacteraceae bacterium]|jgi:ABC-type ATPase involved in cell division
MNLIKIERYSLAPWGASSGIRNANFVLRPGEVIAITLDVPDDGHLFLRALATLITPIQGKYFFQGQQLEFSDYRNLLHIKRKIGYVSTDAALISNRTILENLLLMRYYFENSLTIDLNETMETLCSQCGLHDKLRLRPANLNPLDVQLVIYIRELAKQPKILLLDRPEDIMIPSKNFKGLISHFEGLVSTGLPVVMLSYDPGFIERFATKVVQIRDGKIAENPFGNISKEN